MIPAAMLAEWRKFAPWLQSHQVEQDIVLTKALVQIYSDPYLVSRAEFEANLHRKLEDRAFIEDIQPLLKPDTPTFNAPEEGLLVKRRTLSLLPGEPWKGETKNV